MLGAQLYVNNVVNFSFYNIHLLETHVTKSMVQTTHFLFYKNEYINGYTTILHSYIQFLIKNIKLHQMVFLSCFKKLDVKTTKPNYFQTM